MYCEASYSFHHGVIKKWLRLQWLAQAVSKSLWNLVQGCFRESHVVFGFPVAF